MSKVDGRLTYEVLLERLDAKLVKMQFQMSAMRVVGDPVTYFTKYPGRFISMHLQGVNSTRPCPGPAPQAERARRRWPWGRTASTGRRSSRPPAPAG